MSSGAEVGQCLREWIPGRVLGQGSVFRRVDPRRILEVVFRVTFVRGSVVLLESG